MLRWLIVDAFCKLMFGDRLYRLSFVVEYDKDEIGEFCKVKVFSCKKGYTHEFKTDSVSSETFMVLDSRVISNKEYENYSDYRKVIRKITGKHFQAIFRSPK